MKIEYQTDDGQLGATRHSLEIEDCLIADCDSEEDAVEHVKSMIWVDLRYRVKPVYDLAAIEEAVEEIFEDIRATNEAEYE